MLVRELYGKFSLSITFHPFIYMNQLIWLITIKANSDGYAWDGCTPKYSFLGLKIVGVPDGHIDIETMKPKTYYASLVHDAFYQYLEDVPVTKKEIDKLFVKMLEERYFPLARFYFLVMFEHLGRGWRYQGWTQNGIERGI